MKRIQNIEFLKFIFAMIIVWFHLVGSRLSLFCPKVNWYETLKHASQDGNKAVDFMFILAGFFLLYTYRDINFLDYTKKKVCRLFPVVSGSLLFYLLFNFKYFRFFDDLYALFFINNIGFTLNLTNNGSLWFISVYFWVSLFFFYLIKNYNAKHVSLFLAFVIWFSYSFLIHARSEKLENQILSYGYVFNIGVLRGLAGMAVGYFIALLYNSENTKKLGGKISTYFFTVVEFVLLSFVIFYLTVNHLGHKNNMIFILAFIIIIWSFVNHKGYISRILENKYSEYLGRYSFTLFMMNSPVYDFINHTFWKNYPKLISEYPIMNIILSMLSVVAVSIVMYHFVELPGVKLMRNWLIKQPSTYLLKENENDIA